MYAFDINFFLLSVLKLLTFSTKLVVYLQYKTMLLYIVGYQGVDCSLNNTEIPFLVGMRAPGPLCDVRGSTPCTAVSLFAEGFSFTDNFACLVVSIHITQFPSTF